MIPNAFNWRTLDNGGSDAGKSVQEHICHDNVDCPTEIDIREDSQVEEAYRGFGQIDGELVDDLGYPECLQRPVRSAELLSNSDICLLVER